MNKYMVTALNVLSHVDIKSNYKLIRQVQRIAKKPRIKLLYQTWDYYIQCENHRIPVRVFSPSQEKIAKLSLSRYPVIIFFHGGGWVTGDLDSYEKVCLTIARQTGHIVVAVEYRLAPENPFPAALEDCYEVVKATIRLCEKARIPRQIVLIGDSAGGNLAAALSLYMRDKGEKIADKQILIYPAAYNNHTKTSPFRSVRQCGKDYILTAKHIRDYMDMYCSRREDRSNPYLAPLLAEDFSRQPETLIITAEFDPLRDEGEEYGRKLREAGNTVVIRRMEDTLHGYFSLSIRYSAVKDTYNIINQFLKGEKIQNE